ncbi:MAG: hypothetical protein Unbinned3818contig1000_2 [Prokaryotic dsDNA virus sp.]|nr:hypothetical protein [Phycisphaerae bacterium]QDP45931.1 MAG: hypothetical protein Unbinned3818contig1000_2 [Prokaryotic dsDNA virus sp.]
MKVYLFSDYLEAINGEPLSEDQAICEIDAIEKMPNGIVKIKGKLARVCCFFREKDHIYIEYVTCPFIRFVMCF